VIAVIVTVPAGAPAVGAQAISDTRDLGLLKDTQTTAIFAMTAVCAGTAVEQVKNRECISALHLR
jgi:hypothetical protein